MLLHAALRWPEMADVSLWPMTLSHAVLLWNNTPNLDTGLLPLEVFSCSKLDVPIIQQQHVWGCPVYVLHPTLKMKRTYSNGSQDQEEGSLWAMHLSSLALWV